MVAENKWVIHARSIIVKGAHLARTAYGVISCDTAVSALEDGNPTAPTRTETKKGHSEEARFHDVTIPLTGASGGSL